MAEHPGRFFRVVTANTGLPTGDQPMPDAWVRLREVTRTASALSVFWHPPPADIASTAGAAAGPSPRCCSAG
jgi:hypothetical protein